jgi:hypothetical protein
MVVGRVGKCEKCEKWLVGRKREKEVDSCEEQAAGGSRAGKHGSSRHQQFRPIILSPLLSHVLGKRWQIYKDTVLAYGMHSINNNRYGNGLPLPVSDHVDPSNVPPQKPLNSSQHPLMTKLPP